jgi:hypothetical protein
MPTLSGDYNSFRNESTRLANLLASTVTLAPAHRKLVAEIALLRLAILIENSMKQVFCKLICGALYIDGTVPALLLPQRNIPAALSAMQTFSRKKKRYRLPWNDGAEIRDNVTHLIGRTDPCYLRLVTYAAFLTEIRYIRNHIAHRNENSRANFVKLIRKYYGASVPGVTCGNLLVSPRVSPRRPLIETYIILANIMMKEIVQA